MSEYPLLQEEDSGSRPTSPLQLEVQRISKNTARRLYYTWHYLKNTDFIASYNFGAYFKGWLVGAISFGPPSAKETIQGIFKEENQKEYFEIKRLAMSDLCPRNSESRFLAIALRLLRKSTKVKAIITYADTAVGHIGIIYRASNFEYLGLTKPKKDFWVNGKIQQRGKTKGVAGEWRDRSRKHCYVKRYGETQKVQNTKKFSDTGSQT